MNCFAIIPAFNEEKNIAEVVTKTRQQTPHIIVVDDGSKDKTSEVAAQAGAKVALHQINLGKGASIRTGCEIAIKRGADVIVLIDGDGQHEPEDIQEFLKKIHEGYDVIFSYRKFDKNMPLVFKIGNTAITKITQLLYKIKLKDTQCGYRAFRSEHYAKIKWESTGYSMESEMIANVAKAKLKYVEVPIKTVYKDATKGTTVLDGIKIVIDMILWKIR